MNDDRKPLVVLVSVPDAATGNDLARRLVESGLAACVTRLPGARSIYRWQGALETADEELLLVKSVVARWPALREAIRSAHPYDVPEILALPVLGALAEYADWLAESTTDGAGAPVDAPPREAP